MDRTSHPVAPITSAAFCGACSKRASVLRGEIAAEAPARGSRTRRSVTWRAARRRWASRASPTASSGTFFHVDFLEQLDGVEVGEGSFTATFRRDDGSEVGSGRRPCASPVRHRASIQGRDFDFLKSITARTPKVCIPSPSMLHFRGGRQAISADVCRARGVLARPRRRISAEILDLAARGCRYLQLDDTNLAYLCDDQIRAATRRAATIRTSCRISTAA